MDQTLILTLQLDEAAQAFYNDLRQKHFPPGRNLIPAHLTLFHNLPEQENIFQALRERAAATVALPLGPGTLRSIGKGVAVFFASQAAEALVSLHTALAGVFDAHLIAQDRQRFLPHIVVQNKVDQATARLTLAQIDPGSLPAPHGTGLTVWRYLGGPWGHLLDLPFSDSQPAAGVAPKK